MVILGLNKGSRLNKHYLELDLIKGVMIVFVILLHSCLVFGSVLPKVYPKSLDFIIPFSISIAVPVFFIVMGRNYGASFKRHHYTTLKSIYSLNYFKKQLKRTVYPLFIIAVLSIPIGLLVNGHLYFGVETLIGRIPFGGRSIEWGNYFASIILEFIFIFPLMYIVYKKYPNLMLILAFILNLLFELVAVCFPIFWGYDAAYIYRASIFRYLFVIALGLWVADKLTVIPVKELLLKYKFILFGLSLSLIVIFENAFYGIKLPFFLYSWQPQNLLAAFYPFVIVILLFHILPSETGSKIVKFVGSLGKASYHIFLIQILFFASGYTGAKLILKTRLYTKIGAYGLILSTILDLTICISLGFLFYHTTTKNPMKKLKPKKEDTEIGFVIHSK